MQGWITAAKRYRDRAEHCQRIARGAASLEIRMHYLEMTDHYFALAEVEERLVTGGAAPPKTPIRV